MRIEHTAVGVNDIEVLRELYSRWFGATANHRYANADKGFASYFLSVGNGPCLEIMP